MNRAPVAPVRIIPDTPLKLEEIIHKALEKDRNVGCQSAAELRADLKRDTESGKTAAPASSAHTTSSSAVITVAKQHKLGVAAGVVAVLIVLGVLVLGFILS
ncbi:MAG: hypothetical protein WB919_04190 [Candidatus Sulfotelmatobacter sp.]